MATKKTAKVTKDYSVMHKRSGRYAVVDADGKYINGEKKRDILVKEGLVKMMKPKKADAPAAVEETPAT